jgi:hypothetical protein
MSKWKETLRHEMIDYGINVIYLTLVFSSFFVYQRLLLASHDITYMNYGMAVIEALILGKVIMIGGVFHLGQGLENKPLIFPTLYKTVAFTVLVAIFKVIEYGIKGLWHDVGFMGGLAGFSEKGWDVVLANSLVVVVAFIPFFAMKELGRVLGGNEVRKLFFQRRSGS